MASKSSKRENLIKMAEEWSISVKELAENMLKIENNQSESIEVSNRDEPTFNTGSFDNSSVIRTIRNEFDNHHDTAIVGPLSGKKRLSVTDQSAGCDVDVVADAKADELCRDDQLANDFNKVLNGKAFVMWNSEYKSWMFICQSSKKIRVHTSDDKIMDDFLKKSVMTEAEKQTIFDFFKDKMKFEKLRDAMSKVEFHGKIFQTMKQENQLILTLGYALHTILGEKSTVPWPLCDEKTDLIRNVIDQVIKEQKLL